MEVGSLPLRGEGLPKVIALISIVAPSGAPFTGCSAASNQGEEVVVVAAPTTAAKGGPKEGEAMRPQRNGGTGVSLPPLFCRQPVEEVDRR